MCDFYKVKDVHFIERQTGHHYNTAKQDMQTLKELMKEIEMFRDPKNGFRGRTEQMLLKLRVKKVFNFLIFLHQT